jgi:Spy/CpxP family protein refolding chaperone
MNDNQTPKLPESTPQATPPVDPGRGRRLRRWTLAGIAAAAVGAFAFHNLAHGAHGAGCGHRGMHGSMDPESVGKFIDWRVSSMLSKVDATPEQKSKIGDIAKTAVKELAPLRAQHQAARAKAMELFTQPTVDRAALEKLRADELQLAETVSKRATQAIADAADVLTPAQRVKLAERWKQRRG